MSRFLDACACKPLDRPPVWLMRQAGRYLPEYQAVRAKYSFIDLCKTPSMAAEVTLQPVRLLGVDAAILFSDILMPVEPMGIRLDFAPGPQLENPIRSLEDVEALATPDIATSLDYTFQAIDAVKAELPEGTPLIGFSGAPFTVASYMIEGSHGQRMLAIREKIMREANVLHALLEKLTEHLGSYLVAKSRSGCAALQIFESWAELLSPRDYDEFAAPYIQKLMERLRKEAPNTPIILFAKDAGARLPQHIALRPDVISLDWRVDLRHAMDVVPADIALQGNLDPAVLLGDVEGVRVRTTEMLEIVGRRPGYIANLGHGVLPSTPPQNVQAFVETVQNWRA